MHQPLHSDFRLRSGEERQKLKLVHLYYIASVLIVSIVIVLTAVLIISPPAIVACECTQCPPSLPSPRHTALSFLLLPPHPAQLMLSMLGFKSTETGRVSEEELRLIVTGAKMSGGIESQEGMMIEGVLDLQVGCLGGGGGGGDLWW